MVHVSWNWYIIDQIKVDCNLISNGFWHTVFTLELKIPHQLVVKIAFVETAFAFLTSNLFSLKKNMLCESD